MMVLLPVLAAVRAGSLGAGLGAAGAGVGNYPAASLAYNVSPTGNGWPTQSTFSVQVCVPTLPATAGLRHSPHQRCHPTLASPGGQR